MNVTNDIVTRFLNWPLPQSVLPDSCVMDRNYPNRIGTNLLTATEARQMLEHVLQLPEPAKAAGEARQYAQRDSEALGEDYMRHVDAMTREGIHSKAAIAGELAHRDAEIARLRQVVERLSTERDRLEAGWRQAERERDSLATENDGLRVEAKLAMEATGCDDPVKALSTIRRWHEEDSALRQEKEAAERRVAELEASAAGMKLALEKIAEDEAVAEPARPDSDNVDDHWRHGVEWAGWERAEIARAALPATTDARPAAPSAGTGEGVTK